ncbi:extracellular solute-binding protein family 1 [Paenibacillus curdlanolyticus YK9]|uniref:Extracellular solute-binding protein family 1 n=1 Tax=Paenibacillus curdlanolyticus YK9 TaxID=717606 RepID=E0IBK2_9BACL|nr:extracellular solute-binding protein [Paenibacillus curdlanolyticus]EFM10082.1 extracellular solute-binding protein family 1 [Paenibacillus curdlanolyticus YK9]
MLKKKTFSSLLMLTVCSAVALTACSSKEETKEPTTTEQTQTETKTEGTATTPDANADAKSKVKPVTFTQFVNYDWYTAPKWDERPHAKWITDNLGVTMEPVQSNGAAASKLNSMIVSKKLPDAIVLDRGKDVERLVAAGQLVALDDYLAKYPEFVKTIGEQTLNMLRSADGKLYQIPNWFISGDNGNGNAGYFINKKIYKELGSPALETWDDLEAYLQQVKSKYPDVVPIDFGEMRDSESQMLGMLYSGAANDVTPSFISPGSGAIFGIPNGDKLTSIYEDQAFIDAAMYTSRLFREGLTSKDAFTQTRDQIKEKLKNGKVAVFGAYDAYVEGIGREVNNDLKAKDPSSGYDVIWPVHKAGVDKNKVFPSGYNTLGWNVNVITKSAKDPEAIFAYMNWALSPEGQQIFFFGPQGLFYDEVKDGVPIPNDAYINRDMKKYDDLKIGEFNWYGNTSYVDGTKAKREQLLKAEAQDWTTIAQSTISFKTSKDITEFSNLDPVPNSEEGIIIQRLRDYYKTFIPKVVFAKSDDEVKQLIADAQAESVKLGYNKVLDWKTAVWQKNLQTMKK